MRKFSKSELIKDLRKINGTKRKNNFGNNKDQEEDQEDQEEEEQEQVLVNKISKRVKPKNKSRIKRALYGALKATGMKLLDITDYTFKKIISMTIKYVGPIVLTAILIRYREPIAKKLFSREDKEKYDKVAGVVGKGAERVGNVVNGGKDFLRV